MPHGNRGVRYEQEFRWGGREGAACDELAAVVMDKYFADPQTSFARNTGKAICARCVALPECRRAAFNATMLPKSGVVAGDSVSKIWAARSWRNYESGITDHPPKVDRPDWLPFPESADVVEHTRMIEDGDE